MANIGKVFEGEIRKLLQQENALVIRIPDVLGTKFTIKKEADFVACSFDGHFVLVEAKCTKTTTFAFSRIRPHQREALTTVASTTNGQALLALNFRSPKTGQAYLIPWQWWLNFESGWSRKSIKKKGAAVEFLTFALRRVPNGWEKIDDLFSQT